MNRGGVKSSKRASKESILLDVVLGNVCNHIFIQGWFSDYLWWKPKGECSSFLPKGLRKFDGFEPDGGVWGKVGCVIPVIVFEAKQGGQGGQADTDLGYKNIFNFLSNEGKRGINPEGRYIIIGQGKGCQSNPSAKTKKDIGKYYCFTERVKHFYGDHFRTHTNPEVWTEEQIIKIVFDELCEISGYTPDIQITLPPPVKMINDKYGEGKLDV